MGCLNLIMRIFNSSDKENLGMEAHPAEYGMYLSLVKKNNNPDESTIRKHLEGNLCRCTGYQNIVKSIEEGANKMRELGDI